MNTLSRKVFEEVRFGLSSQNQTEDGVGSDKEDAPERRGFWDGVDLRLGATKADYHKKEREREKETIRKVTK